MFKIKHKTLPVYWKEGDGMKYHKYDLNTGKLLKKNDESATGLLVMMYNGFVEKMTEDEPEEQVENSRWDVANLNNSIIFNSSGYGKFWIVDHLHKCEIQPLNADWAKTKKITNKSSVDRLEKAFSDFKKVIREVSSKEYLND